MRNNQSRSDFIEIAPEILLFGQKVLTIDQLKFADELAFDLAIPKKRRGVIKVLQKEVGSKPNRPLYYVEYHLTHLPRWTRDSMRYLGDYIDQLMKFLTSEKLEHGGYLARSLGYNLNKLRNKNILPQNLINQLYDFNSSLYVPAKHDFDVKNRSHRFTSKEVVYACFITMVLGKKLISLSERAKEYAEQRTHEYYTYDELTTGFNEEIPKQLRDRF